MVGSLGCSFEMISGNEVKLSLVSIIGRLSLWIVNLIILWVNNLSLQCIIDRNWFPLMIKGEHYTYQVMKLLMMRFPDRHTNQVLAKLNWDYKGYIMNILLSIIELEIVMCIHEKIMVLNCTNDGVIIYMDAWGLIQLINNSAIR